MCMTRSSPITSPGGSRSTSMQMTSSGARRTLAGSPAPPTASSPPSPTVTTMIVDQAEFDAERWYRILQEQKVSVWYTAPTAIRMLMKAGTALAKRYDLSSLRFMASVGEPLNAEAVIWGLEAFGMPFHDNWWQTETGGIMIANYASMDVKPGSMGRPLPGITAGIVERAADGDIREIRRPCAWASLRSAQAGRR